MLTSENQAYIFYAKVIIRQNETQYFTYGIYTKQDSENTASPEARDYLKLLSYIYVMELLYIDGFAFDVMAAMLEAQHKGIFYLLSDPAGLGGWHCVQHPERLIANQQEYAFKQALTQLVGKTASMKRCYVKS